MAEGSDAAGVGAPGASALPSLDALPVAAVVVVDGVVVEANAAAMHLAPAEGLGGPLEAWFGPSSEADHGIRRLAGREEFVQVLGSGPDGDGRQLLLLVEATQAQFTRHALDAVADSTFVLDGVGRPRWRSEQLRRRSGLSDAEASKQNPSERIHPEDLPTVLDTFVDAKPDRPSRVVVRSRAVDDDDRWETIEVVVHHRLDHDVLAGYVVQVHNLDDGVHLAGGLGRADAGWQSLTETLPVGIVVTDIAGEIVYRNALARRLLGPDVEWLGHDQQWLELARPEDRDALRGAFDAAIHDRRSTTVTAAFEVAGATRWLRLATSPQASPSGRSRGLIATLEDVTEEVEARAQLETAQALLRHLADHDPLTGLPNRGRLTTSLAEMVERHDAGGPGIAVLFCDLDGFKPINDRHGHGAGDAVLVDVAGRLRAAVEELATVARIGGDEFVVLREGGDDHEALLELADRLHARLREPFTVEGQPATLAVSIGVATLAGGATATADELLKVADQAMYEAKAAGPGRTVLRPVG